MQCFLYSIALPLNGTVHTLLNLMLLGALCSPSIAPSNGPSRRRGAVPLECRETFLSSEVFERALEARTFNSRCGSETECACSSRSSPLTMPNASRVTRALPFAHWHSFFCPDVWRLASPPLLLPTLVPSSFRISSFTTLLGGVS